MQFLQKTKKNQRLVRSFYNVFFFWRNIFVIARWIFWMGERIFDNIVLMCMNGFYTLWIEESRLHKKIKFI